MNHKQSCFGMIPICLILMLLGIGCKEEATGPRNHNPTITSLAAFPDVVHPLDSFVVFCSAYDIDGDTIVYDWYGPSISGAEPPGYMLMESKENFAVFHVPDSAYVFYDSARVDVDVRDHKGGSAQKTVFIPIKM